MSNGDQVGPGGPRDPTSLRGPVATRDDITTLAHYFRGELGRMISWRDRIDRTTNWSIGAVAAMLSVSLASPSAHHGVILFAMALTYLLLHIEARRYRFFDVYRTRVRLLERNYYCPFFSPRAEPHPGDWALRLGDSLRLPRFHLSLQQAMARRLTRNYRWIFAVLLAAWLLKTTAVVSLPAPGAAHWVHSLREFLGNTALGPLPGELVVLALVAFYSWLVWLLVRHREARERADFGEVRF